MPSRAFIEFQERAQAAPQPDPPDTIQELRARIDATMGELPLAEGVAATPVDAGGVPAIWLHRTSSRDEPVLCYFHGGGYRIGSALAYRAYGSQLAAACRARVLMVDYRLAPEHPFPAAVDDAMAAYGWLLAQGDSPSRVVLAGDSAGGGLAAASLLAARGRDLPLPAGAACLSPWADLRNEAESYQSRADTDSMFSLGQAQEASGLYLAGHDRSDPLVSPVLGDWSGMPPLLIHASEHEVLIDDAHALAARAKSAGVDVRLSVYPDMPHVWHMHTPAFPEAVAAVEEVGAFLRAVTDP